MEIEDVADLDFDRFRKWIIEIVFVLAAPLASAIVRIIADLARARAATAAAEEDAAARTEPLPASG